MTYPTNSFAHTAQIAAKSPITTHSDFMPSSHDGQGAKLPFAKVQNVHR